MKRFRFVPLFLFIVLLFMATECPKPRLISIMTGTVISVTDNSASIQGEVIDLGEGISEHGHCWSIAPKPNVESNSGMTNLGRKEHAGTFISNLSNLSSNTQYYIRAYASVDNEPPSYGEDVVFTTDSYGQPIVTTSSETSPTATSATVGGEVVSNGGASITDRGVFWGTTANPKNIRYKLAMGSGTGSFSDELTGLTPGTPYMVEAYAINSVDTGYGGKIYFTTSEDNSTVTDIDGNVYSTIQIGDQLWMAENLKVTRFADGTSIPLVEDNTVWDTLTYTDKAYCWYDDQSSNGDTYGALYTWAAAMNSEASSDANPSGVQGVCPDGWHLPSDSEWKELEMYLGMSQSVADVENAFRGSDEGDQLKESGTSHWISPNSGTNISGFTALPGGKREHNGSFGSLGYEGLFWTATLYINSSYGYEPWVRNLSYNESGVERNFGSYTGKQGFSVRCVKD